MYRRQFRIVISYSTLVADVRFASNMDQLVHLHAVLACELLATGVTFELPLQTAVLSIEVLSQTGLAVEAIRTFATPEWQLEVRTRQVFIKRLHLQTVPDNGCSTGLG